MTKIATATHVSQISPRPLGSPESATVAPFRKSDRRGDASVHRSFGGAMTAQSRATYCPHEPNIRQALTLRHLSPEVPETTTIAGNPRASAPMSPTRGANRMPANPRLVAPNVGAGAG